MYNTLIKELSLIMKGLKKILYFPLFLAIFISLISCNKNNSTNTSNDKLSKTEYFMGTVLTITLYDTNNEEIIEKAFKRVKEIEALVSINTEGTELDKVNEKAGIEPVKVSNDTFNIVKKGLEYTKETKGYFDISIGPIVKLWSIGLPEAKIPTKEEISDKLQYINYDNIILDEKNQSIFLKEKGMILDLGAIAKGYTADEISSILIEEGITRAIIDLGGNVFALGEKSENTPWKIGVQNPDATRGEIVGILSIKNKSIVTSGIYERFIEDDLGNRYHHILSPFTGYPYDNEVAGVTIISNKSIDGDALSTSLFAMGVEKGLEFANNRENIEAIYITKDNKIYLSEGVRDMFQLTNEDFTLEN